MAKLISRLILLIFIVKSSFACEKSFDFQKVKLNTSPVTAKINNAEEIIRLPGVFIHELEHAVMAKVFGLSVSKMVFNVTWLGNPNPSKETFKTKLRACASRI